MSFSKVFIEGMAYSLPESIVTSAEIEKELSPLYKRINLTIGRLELMTGIKERRFWSSSHKVSRASAAAGSKLLDNQSINPDEVDLLIHAAVCRDRLEPATASYVHRLMGLGGKTQLLDISNACLGFLNALVLASSMIEQGMIKRAIIVAGENGKPLVDETIRILNDSSMNRKTIKPYFANLTIGSAAVAWSIVHKDLVSRDSPRLSQFAYSTDTSQNHLCEGEQSSRGMVMQTDSEDLLHAGINLANKTWSSFLSKCNWDCESPETVITHQVGKAHQMEIEKALGYDPAKSHSSFPTLGNCGSVSLPITYTMASEQDDSLLTKRTALLGIGSGLSSLMLSLNN